MHKKYSLHNGAEEIQRGNEGEAGRLSASPIPSLHGGQPYTDPNPFQKIQIAGSLGNRNARSVNTFPASILSSRLHFRFVVLCHQFLGCGAISVSTERAACQHARAKGLRDESR